MKKLYQHTKWMALDEKWKKRVLFRIRVDEWHRWNNLSEDSRTSRSGYDITEYLGGCLL